VLEHFLLFASFGRSICNGCMLFTTEFNGLLNLIRDKGIYSTQAGSILTIAEAAWDL
jgi:hypothetical protein